MTRKLILIGAMVAGTVLSACQAGSERLAFEGNYYRAKVAKVDGQRDVFTVTVRDVAQSLSGAREAGRHEAVSYCVGTYGSSDIDWVVGPDTPDLRVVDNTIVFRGTCPQ